jgi:hypothetical protein
MYFLDCIFSRAMADTEIYRPKSSPRPYKWGTRHYFYNCHREEGDFVWFKDNLETAAGSPKESDVTAQWTFAGMWDPEGTMPAVLPTVFMLSPREKSYHAPVERTILKWVATRNADSHNVYFGKTKTPEFKKNQQENYFDPETLEPATRYYWRIDEVTGADTLRGAMWHFTTE